MEISDIVRYFELENEDRLEQLTQYLTEINDLPDSFLTLNWHESHDFLWISPSIEQISGHPFQYFQNLGISYIFSITPKKLIPAVSETLGSWRQRLEANPGLILSSVIMDVPGGLIHTNGKTIDLACHSLVMDYSPGKITSFFILTVSFDKSNAGKNLEGLVKRANELQRQIHELYMRMKPTRFNMLSALSSLTSREKEISELLRNGHNSKDIADQLNIAMGTVTSHRKNILKKVGVKNTAELVQLMNKFIN